MKMKKTYAAALAAAMVLTAGLSAQAADFTFEGEAYGWVTVTGTGTIEDSEIVDAVNGKDLALGAGTTIAGQAIATTDDLQGYATAEGLTSVATDTAYAKITAEQANTQAQTNAGDIKDLQGTVNEHTEQINALQQKNNEQDDSIKNVAEQANAAFNGMTSNSEKISALEGTVSEHIDEDGNVSGANGTFTGSISAADGDFTVSESGMIQSQTGGVIGGVTISGGRVAAETGLSAAGGKFVVDGSTGSVSTDSDMSVGGNLTVDGKISGDTGSFNTVTANQGAFGSVDVNDKLTVGGKDVGAALDQHDAAITETQHQVAENTQKISSFDGRLNSLDSKVSDLGGEIDNVGAISSALAGLHPLDYDGTGSKFQLAAAMGSYDGTQAAAIGGFYHFNEDIMMSVGGATSFGGDNKSAFNVGLSFRVGQGSSGKRVSNDEVLAQLTAMNDKIAALEAENQQLSEKVAALEGGEGAEAAEAE